jgi:SIR2-like domain
LEFPDTDEIRTTKPSQANFGCEAQMASTKFLSYFPKPLLDDLVNGRWLPVVGAGMSMNAILQRPAKMPLWGDLAKHFAAELREYEPTGVLDAISAFEHEFGRTTLIERLADLLHINKAQPGAAHKEFCSLPFDIVCTTNFGFLLEKQYDLELYENRSIHLVVDEDQLSINLGVSGTLLLKLHGDLRHPKRIIITESDYDGFLSNYPLIATYLSNQLITKTAVFVGYSLDDPDFRQIWHVVSNRLGRARRMAYAIVVNARPGDTARFERRGVKVINLPGARDHYGEVLADAFRELREYRREHAGPTLKPTDEKSLEQLLLPRNAVTRLCFFALPLEVLPFYRERIFPLAENAGFVPVTAADVVNLGESVSAKIDTLIDRAAVMVVLLTSAWTRAEFGKALARQEQSIGSNRMPLRIVSIVTESSQVPPHHVICRL